ncbi:MAG TPA: amidophosphoribosyltransferase [Bdellovibrionota bacterium]|nr:amidophosphoribosyltransferase [Bdellovibrionota bacterium]
MCGIFGIAGNNEASNLTYLGLYALQHRGQESAGIVSADGKRLFKMRRRSLVSDAFDKNSIEYLRGPCAIGHVRYSTSGPNIQKNVQPFIAAGRFGDLAIAHNGNLTNFHAIRKQLEEQGAVFQSTMDTEVILHLAAMAPGSTIQEKIKNGLARVEGAYSLVFLTTKELIAVRDPMGFRPLALGWLGKSPVFASETCAFDLIGAAYDRELEPGEMITATMKGEISSMRISDPKRPGRCIFEHIYFARPDSTVFGQSVYDVRRRLGHELAREFPLKADVVTPVPDSGVYAAIGYAEEIGIPLQMGFIRNHYVGRTFIEPQKAIRGFGVKIKLNPVRSILAGKRVIVIDDSIVRGTTSKKLIKMIRDAGATEISMLISSPPVVGPCYYGIDTPTSEELIGANKSLDEIRRFIGADQLHYLSMEGVYRAAKGDSTRYCDACFTRNYLTSIEHRTAGSSANH